MSLVLLEGVVVVIGVIVAFLAQAEKQQSQLAPSLRMGR